ncbi:MAG: hypothetical protein GTO14_20895 [Anaerolineales bacterium]|nr:hypothetical protein [Anaerolineales bacterium]
MSHLDYTIGCDAHKHFSLFTVLDGSGNLVQRNRIGHVPGTIRSFLAQFPQGTPVALETVGNWYCLHLWCGTGGSLPRSKNPAAFRSWLMPPKPKS